MRLHFFLSAARGACAPGRIAVFFLAVACSMLPPSALAATPFFENLQAGRTQPVVLYGKALEGVNPGVTIVLQVMNSGWDAPNGNRSQSARPQLKAFNDNYRTYARIHSTMLLDHYPNWRKLRETEPRVFQSYVPDGTHPNATGSLKVTWPVVKGWLESQRKRALAP